MIKKAIKILIPVVIVDFFIWLYYCIRGLSLNQVMWGIDGKYHDIVMNSIKNNDSALWRTIPYIQRELQYDLTHAWQNNSVHINIILIIVLFIVVNIKK